MKTFVISICFFTFLFFTCGYGMNKDEELAQALNLKMIKKFEQTYGLRFMGVELGGPVKIDRMGLYFYINHPMTKDEARRLIVKCSQEYFEAILNYKELQQYLVDPFTIKNIYLRIGFQDKKGDSLIMPELGSIQLSSGRIVYTYYNQENKSPRSEREVETFEEAVKIVEEEQKKS